MPYHISDNTKRGCLYLLKKDVEFFSEIVPLLKPEYFDFPAYKNVFLGVRNYYDKYQKLPSDSVLPDYINATVSGASDLGVDYENTIAEINTIDKSCLGDREFLLDTVEVFARNKSMEQAVRKAIVILNEEGDIAEVEELVKDALLVNRNVDVGQEYFDDVHARLCRSYEESNQTKIGTVFRTHDRNLEGGLAPKELAMVVAPPGVGKSLYMCHVAASSLVEGRNVLYITMEMAEERIAERIDANLLNTPIDQLANMSKDMFTEKVNNLARKTTGRLVVKEYPTGSAHAGHFRALLNELKLKKQFVPDIIFVDYLNICASSRMKGMGGAINSYNYIKAIAEELRGLAVEFDVPIFSATQTTRSGYSNSDVGLEDTSESFGLPATADLMFALISTEELQQLGQIMVKQLKNRYNDPTQNKRFVVGVDRSKMRLFDVDPNEQTLTDDTPVFDKSDAGENISKFKDWNI